MRWDSTAWVRACVPPQWSESFWWVEKLYNLWRISVRARVCAHIPLIIYISNAVRYPVGRLGGMVDTDKTMRVISNQTNSTPAGGFGERECSVHGTSCGKLFELVWTHTVMRKCWARHDMMAHVCVRAAMGKSVIPLWELWVGVVSLHTARDCYWSIKSPNSINNFCGRNLFCSLVQSWFVVSLFYVL